MLILWIKYLFREKFLVWRLSFDSNLNGFRLQNDGMYLFFVWTTVVKWSQQEDGLMWLKEKREASRETFTYFNFIVGSNIKESFFSDLSFFLTYLICWTLSIYWCLLTNLTSWPPAWRIFLLHKPLLFFFVFPYCHLIIFCYSYVPSVKFSSPDTFLWNYFCHLVHVKKYFNVILLKFTSVMATDP